MPSPQSDLEVVEGALPRLKVFPLPNAVLIPGAGLALHVFEDRYRALVADALAGDGVMGVAMLAPGWEPDYHGKPPIRQLLGAGVIHEHEQLADGRYNILLRGVMRVRAVDEEPSAKLFREFRCERAVEIPAVEGELAETLRTCLVELAAVVPAEVADKLAHVTTKIIDSGILCDAVAASVFVEPETRQRVLEALDVAARLQLTVDALGALLLQLRKRDTGLPN